VANYLRGLELLKKQQSEKPDRLLDRVRPAFALFWAG
jgi:hypothetical protein